MAAAATATTAASASNGLMAPLGGKLKRVYVGIGFVDLQRKKRRVFGVKCCCSGSVVPIRGINGSGKCIKKFDNWRFDSKNSSHSYRVKVQASSTMPFPSPK